MNISCPTFSANRLHFLIVHILDQCTPTVSLQCKCTHCSPWNNNNQLRCDLFKDKIFCNQTSSFFCPGLQSFAGFFFGVSSSGDSAGHSTGKHWADEPKRLHWHKLHSYRKMLRGRQENPEISTFAWRNWPSDWYKSMCDLSTLERCKKLTTKWRKKKKRNRKAKNSHFIVFCELPMQSKCTDKSKYTDWMRYDAVHSDSTCLPIAIKDQH